MQGADPIGQAPRSQEPLFTALPGIARGKSWPDFGVCYHITISIEFAEGSRAVGDIEPRYEFRVWGENLAEFRKRLERRAAPVQAASKEIYLISRATDRCNAKIRADLMDIKVLIAEHRGLEQWKPVLKAAFPIDRSVIATQIFPSLEIRPPPLSKARYEMGEFLNEVIVADAGIAIVELFKARSKFSLGTCLAEFTAVLLNDVARDTVGMESANPDELLSLIREFGLDGAQNVSYVRYIRRALGLEKS